MVIWLIMLCIYHDGIKNHIGKVVVGDIRNNRLKVNPKHKHLKRIFRITLGSGIDVFIFRRSLG